MRVGLLGRWVVLAPVLGLLACGSEPRAEDPPAKDAGATDAGARATDGPEFAEWRREVEGECRRFERFIARMPDPDAGIEQLRGPEKLRTLAARMRPFVERFVAFAEDVRAIPLPERGYSVAIDVNAATRKRSDILQTLERTLRKADVSRVKSVSEIEGVYSAEQRTALDRAGLDCGSDG